MFYRKIIYSQKHSRGEEEQAVQLIDGTTLSFALGHEGPNGEPSWFVIDLGSHPCIITDIDILGKDKTRMGSFRVRQKHRFIFHSEFNFSNLFR